MKSGTMFLAKGYYAPIRHDKGVHIRLRGDNGTFDTVHFAFKHYGIEGKIGLCSAFAAATGYLGQIPLFEVDAAACTHIESAETEIYGIGTSV